MKHQVSPKLLILFFITSGIFFFANSGHCATVYTRGTDVNTTTIANKSSTFSTKMSNESDDDYNTNDSALAEQIRAQRAALDSKATETGVKLKNKSGGTKNNCDAALRKCITTKCAADYSKCATDSDTIFSDKLNACKKDANCNAREFTLFTNEIKEDKKQEIRLAAYNQVITCGNKYNDCIIAACGPRFNKCLSKSAGDKAIAGCKKIATDCTEADSGLAGRIGSIFGTVRQDAEKQIKEDEKKLYSLRDQMRNSCQMLGAMFDERSLDCVFTATFFAGDDQEKPMASKKVYAGSTFDCSPDWFGIDITTFKENAYRLTRAQTAASSAMLGSGVGTAVGALTSGAIGRAIDTKKAKDALEEECEKAGKVLKDGKCEDSIIEGRTGLNPNDIIEGETESPTLTPQDKCKNSNGTYSEETNPKCTCPSGTELSEEECIENTEKKQNSETKEDRKKCTDTGGTYSNNKCNCDLNKGLIESSVTKGTCNCFNASLRITNGANQTPALNKEGKCSYLYADNLDRNIELCSKYGSSTLLDTGCSCPANEHYVQVKHDHSSRGEPAPGYFYATKCDCEDGYEMKDYKCVSKKSSDTTPATNNNSKTGTEEITRKVESASCNGLNVSATKAKTAAELECVSSMTAVNLCHANGNKSHGFNVKCDPKTKKCAHSCYDMMGEKTYFVACCNIDTTSGNVTCKKTNKTGKSTDVGGPTVSISDCK